MFLLRGIGKCTKIGQNLIRNFFLQRLKIGSNKDSSREISSYRLKMNRCKFIKNRVKLGLMRDKFASIITIEQCQSVQLVLTNLLVP